MKKKSLSTLIVFTALLGIPTTQLTAKCKKEDKNMCICAKGSGTGKLICKQNKPCKCAMIYAAGDQFEFDVTDMPKNDLGMLVEEKQINVDFPEIGDKRLYTLTPVSGESANMHISLLLASSPANEESRQANPNAKSIVKIYRQYQGEQLWTEADTIHSSSEKMDAITIRIKPDATAIIATPEGEDLVMDFGKMILG